MAMLQHYYTSCVSGTTGSSGFQVKAMSPGIRAEDIDTLNRNLNYRIPTSADEFAVESHPVALRYTYLNSNRCLLICSQSNGTDENGRPGNFFAHSVITDIDDFSVLSPIMYWRHPFWRKQDNSNALEIPPQSFFDEEPSLGLEEIWFFLADQNRREWFYKLLCAVIRYNEDNRPIIILDEIENVALWIAAATFALPAIYRPFLTFATYHHNPYQVSFQIIGTTRDSQFRFSPEEYMSHFIINTSTGRVSDVDDSIYANYVVEYFDADNYDSKLMDFFLFCQSRLPARSRQYLATKLDGAANMYLTLRERTLAPTEKTAQNSLAQFIQQIKTEIELTAEEVKDLQVAAELFREALIDTPNKTLVDYYGQTLHLLKKHDPNFARYGREDLFLLAEFMLQNEKLLVNELMTTLKSVYSQVSLSQIVSRSEFLDYLNRSFNTVQLSVHELFWQTIGPLFQVNAKTSPYLSFLIGKALSAVNTLPHGEHSGIPDAGKPVLNGLIHSFNNERQTVLLNSAMDWEAKEEGPAFYWLYYLLVRKLALADRVNYRHYIQRNRSKSPDEDLILYEVEQDLYIVAVNEKVAQLEAWIEHTNDKPNLVSQILDIWLNHLWSHGRGVDKEDWARQIVLSDQVGSKLPSYWSDQIMSALFDRRQIQVLNSELYSVYGQHAKDITLTDAQRGLIAVSLAAASGKLIDRSLDDVQAWLKSLNETEYETAVDKLLHRFSAEKVSIEDHIDMLQAIYLERQNQIFWDFYWNDFRKLLDQPTHVGRLITLLEFWFEQSTSILSDHPYLAPGFFLQLPAILEEAQSERSFKQVLNLIEAQAKNRGWYPLIERYLVPEKKKGFLGILNRKGG